MLLADEINRTPPKTQAALLQAMQEYRVTAGGTTYPLDLPFLVFATQNPIEQEGTYPLPEAQLDRFMFHVDVDYPSADGGGGDRPRHHRRRPARRCTGCSRPERIRQLQELVLRVPVADHVVTLRGRAGARAPAPSEPGAPDFVKEYVAWGAGPRAGQYLVLGAKSRAILDGRVRRLAWRTCGRWRGRVLRPPGPHQLPRRERGRDQPPRSWTGCCETGEGVSASAGRRRAARPGGAGPAGRR